MDINYDIIKKLIPNVLFETEDEPSVFDAITPWILEAENWVKDNITGHSDEILDKCGCSAVNTVVYRAFALAIPHIDITVTPTGLGVVSTQNIAPASKERVERLVNGTWKSHDVWLSSLVIRLFEIEEWRDTPQAVPFCCSLLKLPSDAVKNEGQEIFDAFLADSALAMRFEEMAADRYIGPQIMKIARDFIHFGAIPQDLQQEKETVSNIAHLLKLAVKSWIKAAADKRMPHPREVFDLVKPALSAIKSRESLFILWRQSFEHTELSECQQAQGAFFF